MPYRVHIDTVRISNELFLKRCAKARLLSVHTNQSKDLRFHLLSFVVVV